MRPRVLLLCLLALLALLAAASPAAAVVQTVTDPDDPFEVGYDSSFDVHKVTLDSDTDPANLLVTLEIDFNANASISGSMHFDTNLDGRAERALYITGMYGASKHPNLDGTDGNFRTKLRTVTTSTEECQSFDDGGTFDENIWEYPNAPVTLRTADTMSVVTIPVPLAALGNPTALRWALVGESYRLGPHYEFVPDATRGADDPYGESGGVYCSPEGGMSGWQARMNQGGLLQLADDLPEPTIAQDPTSARPGQTVTFTGGTADNRPVAAYAWDLDHDGQYDDATGRTASRSFPSCGTRFVGLKVTDTAGRTGTAERTVVIADRQPTVTIGQNPALARPNRAVSLAANVTDDGTAASFAWDLDDDGDFDDGSTATVTRTWSAERTYRVRVRVTDDGGNEVRQERAVEVAERAPTITLRTTKADPVAREKFTLTADVTDDGDHLIDWGFNANDNDALDPYDKATGNSWTLSFGWPGRYTMKARVTDDTGKVATAQITVVVPNQPATFREIRAFKKVTPYNPYNTEPLVKQQTITLQALLYDDNAKRPRVEWDLNNNGDYDDAVGEEIDHVFTSAGAKTVRVRMVDEAGAVTLGQTTFDVRDSATSGCAGEIETNLMRLQGCWKTDPKGVKTTKEPIKMNGLDIKPLDGAQLNYQPVGGLLFTTGQGKVRISTGGTVLFEGQFEMDPKCNPKAESCLVGKWSVPPIAKLKGLPLKGEAEV